MRSKTLVKSGKELGPQVRIPETDNTRSTELLKELIIDQAITFNNKQR